MDTIVVVDFGGQYTHLIANRIRRLGVYSEIVSPEVAAESLKRFKGIILSGSPHSVYDPASPKISPAIFDLNLPILGLCYGHHLVSTLLGGKVSRGDVREFGAADLTIVKNNPLFSTLAPTQRIWMSHGDAVERLPSDFDVLATTPDCVYAAVGNVNRRIYGLQFHPEVTDTEHGMTMLGNFQDICGCCREWNTDAFQREIIADIQKKATGKKVFLLVSGGVDSTVAFTLLNKALGPERVMGLHIDNGLMRHGESANVIDFLNAHGFSNLHVVDASEDFISALNGVVEPEQKRKIIGNTFISVKERAQKALGLSIDEWLLAQGTIYPDTIESAGTKYADKIKTHHNRVDIILELMERGLLIEPLAQLYKDEVRQLGENLGIPHHLIWRHPFPGPGLGVRLLCSTGNEGSVSQSDQDNVAGIVREYGYTSAILPIRSVGVQGDCRTYAHPAVVYGACDFSLLEKVSTHVTNNVRAVNRVVYCVWNTPHIAYSAIPAYTTRTRLDLLRMVDKTVNEIVIRNNEYGTIWQMPVVLLPMVNSSGGQCVVLRPVSSQEAMTARFYRMHEKTISEIVAAVKAIDGIGDIFYDITHKPPATIEWE